LVFPGLLRSLPESLDERSERLRNSLARDTRETALPEIRVSRGSLRSQRCQRFEGDLSGARDARDPSLSGISPEPEMPEIRVSRGKGCPESLGDLSGAARDPSLSGLPETRCSSLARYSLLLSRQILAAPLSPEIRVAIERLGHLWLLMKELRSRIESLDSIRSLSENKNGLQGEEGKEKKGLLPRDSA